jgi:uncharacterized damage-inducible protein DinB
MTTAAAPTGQVPLDLLFADLEQEFAATRRMLERFPDEQVDWTPHEKSMSLGTLASHVAELPFFGEVIASMPVFDFAARKYEPANARTREQMLQVFDERSARARTAIAGLGPEELMANWELRWGERVLVSGPRAVVLRSLLFSHVAHHRGQLSVYYRMVGVPVPGTYGPSADEG